MHFRYAFLENVRPEPTIRKTGDESNTQTPCTRAVRQLFLHQSHYLPLEAITLVQRLREERLERPDSRRDVKRGSAVVGGQP